MNNQDKEILEVLDQLSILSPDTADAPRPANESLALLKAEMTAVKTNAMASKFKRSLDMLYRKRQIAFTASLVMLLAVLVSFPVVRTAASDFLGLFRVQKFAPISITPQQFALLEQLAEDGMTPGEFNTRREPGASSPVDSLAEAGRTTGLKPRTLSALDEADQIYVLQGGDGYLIIDVEASRAIVEAAGADPALLPDSLDGQRVDVAVFPGIQQEWDEYTLMQAESPLVEYPPELDPVPLGEALLQVLGTPANEAHRIAQNFDWASTLLLPLPSQAVNFKEIYVDGVSGVALTPMSGAVEGALLWQKEGRIYMFAGPGPIEELLALANSIR
ncbi:MAG: hypothetical protein R3293_22270 [Candidatus Promineifilaceae bacterium]|nr:hypothetical protein [Candidatus Promineifilaceae bacterium]